MQKEIKLTEYVCQLPEPIQSDIIDDVADFHFCQSEVMLTPEDIEIVQSGRLCDLEEVIDVEKYLTKNNYQIKQLNT